MKRREFLKCAAGGVLTAGAARGARSRPPNIVLIIADDLGIGDLGCYGQKRIRTPNIDRIAAEGMRFTAAYAGCTVCAPSRSVLMTGKHMGHASVRANTGGVPLLAEDVTAAEVLKTAGYRTGAFGKWGLGDVGTTGAATRQGFDEFFGYYHQVHAHYYYPEYLYRNEARYPLPGNANGRRGQYSHDVIAEQALDFIRRSKDGSFFCYAPFTIPHWELLVPEDALAEYRGRFPEKPFLDPRRHYADQPESRAAYAAMISRMDRDIGRILKLLAELRIDEDTAVLVTSDNGAAMRLVDDDYFSSTLGLRGHKQNLYEGGIRMPLLARWPGRVKAGSVSEHLCSFQDFLPTAAELAGLKCPSGIDGISFLPELLGRRQRRHEYLYWELPRYDKKTASFRAEIPMQAVRVGDWKAVRPAPDGPLELYNLRADPQETKDLAGTHPEMLARLERILKSARTEPRPQAEPPGTEWSI